MPKLLLRGAFIRFVDMRFDEKSKTTYLKLNITADLSDPVMETMEWEPPGTGQTDGGLDGEVVATHFILTPNGKELKQHEIQLSAKEMRDFSWARVKNDGGDSTHNELRFQLITCDKDAGAKIHEYLNVIGKGEAQLRVNYEAQQELIDDDEETDTPDSERLISKEQAADTSAAADQPGENAGPTLAPAVLAGGTHQRNTRQQQGCRGEPRDREREAVADGTAIQ